jgi:hypothetical protein
MRRRPEGERENLDGRMVVGGRRCDARDGNVIASTDPATTRQIASLAAAGAADVDDAVASARASLDAGWLNAPPADRATILFRLASLIREHADELARIESLDVGKPLREAYADVKAAAAYFEFYAGLDGLAKTARLCAWRAQNASSSARSSSTPCRGPTAAARDRRGLGCRYARDRRPSPGMEDMAHARKHRRYAVAAPTAQPLGSESKHSAVITGRDLGPGWSTELYGRFSKWPR